MIRFRIVGRGYLELPADFEFSFNYNNGVFAFENMQLSRSGEFTIPRTPANDLMLNFSHDPSFDGTFIRQKKSAELFYSGGKIDGYLFIGKCSGKGYSSVFVYGELTALKLANDRGIIFDYVPFSDYMTVQTPTVNPYNVNGILTRNFAFYNYMNGIDESSKLVDYCNMSPTVKLSYLLSQSASYAGVNVDTTALGNGKDAIGIILQSNNASPNLTSVSVTGSPNTNLSFTGGSSFFELVWLSTAYNGKKFKYKPEGAYFSNSEDVRVIKCKIDLTIKFNTGYIFGCVGGTGSTFYSGVDSGNSFGYIESGQEISFKKGEYFTFVHNNDYFFRDPIDNFDGAVNLNFEVYSGDVSSVEYSENYYLKYNLPEVTFMDIVKTFANIFKCGILYNSSTNTISFFNFSFDKSSAKRLDESVINIKSVDRTFLNYARKNLIKYKSEDYVENQTTIQYLIDNDNLAEEKILYTVPFSEGNIDVSGLAILKDFDVLAPYKKIAKNSTIAIASKMVGYNYMMHIKKLYEHFPDILNSKLDEIIQNSTTVAMSVKMTAGDFLKIKNTDTFSYRGKHYCCITGSHSGEVAELTLIKI